MCEPPCQQQRVSPFFRQLFPVSGIVLYMIGTGANIAYPGVLLVQLREPGSALPLTREHESWIASILGLALITGILMAPLCLQRLGRKMTNQISTLPLMAGWALLVAAKEPGVLLTSRFLQGFGMGLQAAAAPVSIGEYSSPENRGAFLATIAFSFGTGMLLAHLLGTYMYWRTAGVACGSFYALSLVLVSLSPETPPYLASKGLYNKCRKSFRWLRGSNEASEKELEIMINNQKNQVKPVKVSRWKLFRDIIKKPEFYKPMFIMIFMFILFQVSGITVIPSYSVRIMNEVTGGRMDGHSSMILVDVVRFIASILSCIVVNRFNRRTVLFSSLYVTVISLFATALLIYLRTCDYLPQNYGWIPVIPTSTYIFAQSIGILPIPWAIAGEVFPLAYRSLGSGISGMVLSIMFFVIVKTAPISLSNIGVSGTFSVYGLFVALCGVFLYYLLPETKGKTLYEIECHFRGETNRQDILDKSENVAMLDLEKSDVG